MPVVGTTVTAVQLPDKSSPSKVVQEILVLELDNFYASPNVIRMSLAGHVARMGENRMHTKFWSRNLRGRITRKI
jgi:hypothetical protein